MSKIFIDNNIFVGLYESKEDLITIFEEISELIPDLIFTDQSYDEFLRNRDKSLHKLIKACEEKNKFNIPSSPMMKSLKEFSELKKIEAKSNEARKVLINKLQDLRDEETKDSVFESFLKLYNHLKVTKYKRNSEIIKKAHERKLLGNPPISEGNTIGDEVIWETILANIKDDLIIVTRDGTYEKYRTFLKSEFNSKTKKQLSIYKNVADAIKLKGKVPSKELKEFDEEQTKRFVDEHPMVSFSPFHVDASGNLCSVDTSGNMVIIPRPI